MSIEVLRLEQIGKSYREFPAQRHRFLSWFGLGQAAYQENWVLQNISFSVHAGEAVGIIGVNGAGKSTLLRIIAGTLSPTTGTFSVAGKVSAILELGMGFNADLTARANAHHACGLMGHSQHDIAAAMDDIESFAEIGDYFDQPLRTFSSGMQMRVAFAVATAFRPEILIIDEALSVGDAYFQHKSAARIRQFKEQGTTLLFVSHDPAAIKTLCDRAVLLDKGGVVLDDLPDQVLDHYNAIIACKQVDAEIRQVENTENRPSVRSGNGRATITAVDMLDGFGNSARTFRVGDEAIIRCRIYYHQEVSQGTVGILLRDRFGNDVFGTNTALLHQQLPVRAGALCLDFSVQLNLGSGSYSLTVAAHSDLSHIQDNHDWWDRVLVFEMVSPTEHNFIGVAALPVTVDIVAQ